MRIFFEMDTETEQDVEEKIKELKEIERIVVEHALRVRQVRRDRGFAEGEKWLKNLPDKYF